MSDEAFVVGMGEVGRRLAAALERAGWTVWPVGRSEGWEAATDTSNPAPRIVAVREEDLQSVLDRLPGSVRRRAVLVQNGFLEAVHGELEPVSRGLIYFTSKKEFYRELCPSPFHGPLATSIAEALGSGGVATELIDDRGTFLKAMIVKGIWNGVVGLPLAVHGVDLATYLLEHRGELEDLADEGARACGAQYGVEVSGAAAVAKLLETTADLGHVKGGAKALAWRNGAIALFGRRHGIPTPVNDRLLRAVGYECKEP
jgi:ketopantoate reductase